MKVLAIRSDFVHHGEHSGYKQILKHTHPTHVIGVDERAVKKQSKWLNAYCWPYEFIGYRYRNEVDLVHHLYADEFYRFSARLFDVPIVGTFHQTPELLERDVIHGDLRGRVARITHQLNKKRFEHLSAAIITNPNQKDVLKRVMPEERIHYIPLGLHFDRLSPYYHEDSMLSASRKVITVGNWQRDWDFYFELVTQSPEIDFILINRKLDASNRRRAEGLSNLIFYNNVDDEELYRLYVSSDVQFLPIKGLAGSNAIIDGLALGCPLVITDIGARAYTDRSDIVRSYASNDLNEAKSKLLEILNQDATNRKLTRAACHSYAKEYDWKLIAERTLDLYRAILNQ